MARVLEPPRVTAVTGRSSPPWDEERAWLRAHAHEYPGCWLAIQGDRLIAASPDHASVVDAARVAGALDEVLLFFQPGEPR